MPDAIKPTAQRGCKPHLRQRFRTRYTNATHKEDAERRMT
jgi:hypothetical protein